MISDKAVSIAVLEALLVTIVIIFPLIGQYYLLQGRKIFKKNLNSKKKRTFSKQFFGAHPVNLYENYSGNVPVKKLYRIHPFIKKSIFPCRWDIVFSLLF